MIRRSQRRISLRTCWFLTSLARVTAPTMVAVLNLRSVNVILGMLAASVKIFHAETCSTAMLIFKEGVASARTRAHATQDGNCHTAPQFALADVQDMVPVYDPTNVLATIALQGRIAVSVGEVSGVLLCAFGPVPFVDPTDAATIQTVNVSATHSGQDPFVPLPSVRCKTSVVDTARA